MGVGGWGDLYPFFFGFLAFVKLFKAPYSSLIFVWQFLIDLSSIHIRIKLINVPDRANPCMLILDNYISHIIVIIFIDSTFLIHCIEAIASEDALCTHTTLSGKPCGDNSFSIRTFTVDKQGRLTMLRRGITLRSVNIIVRTRKPNAECFRDEPR